MVERLHAAESVFESVEDPRKEELRTKLERLDEARSRILADAGARVLTFDEKRAIMRWMKKSRKEEEWPLDDNITRENYQTRVASYGVLELINPDFITGKNDIYNLVNRQYVTLLHELQQLERKPQRFRLVQGGAGESRITPPTEVSPAAPVTEVGERGGEQHEDQKKSWKVWEMIFALLHSMQKHPEEFAELKDLSPDALKNKLTEDGPRLVREYMRIASRGDMEWEEEKKMWDVLDQTKLPNMDVKVGLLVLEKAGFKVGVTPERLQLVPPGNEAAAKPLVLQFDTMDTEKRKRMEAAANGTPIEPMHIENAESPDTDLQPGEYRVTVDHHTDDPRERRTSGAQLLYDYMLAAGMGKFENHTRDPILERLLAFTNADDNGEFPADRDFYRRSASTLWGIASDSSVPASVLYRIMARGRKPEDQFTEEDLNESVNGGLTVRDLVEQKEKRIRKDIREFERWSREGYVIDTDYGPLYVCLNVEGRYMPKQRVARAYGVPNVLIWSPEKHSFFIALGGGKSFKQDVTFPEGAEIVRRHLAIFKRQARTPKELTATLSDILYPFSPKKRRDLQGDLRDYVFGTISDKLTSNETLFSIYTRMPERQGAVIQALVHYPQRLPGIKRLIEETHGETQRIYTEMFDRAQAKLAPPSPTGGSPKGPPSSPREPPPSPPASKVLEPGAPNVEEPSSLLEESKRRRAAEKAAGAKKKAGGAGKRRRGPLKTDNTGEGSEG